MNSYNQHKIELKLNATGYKGEEINDLLPKFMTERDTVIGLTWYPSAEGPESFALDILFYGGLIFFTKAFLEELAKDLYKWVKEKIKPLLNKKEQAFGVMCMKFNDVEIFYYTSGEDEWLSLLEKLPEIVTKVKPELSNEWEIEFKEGRFAVTKFPPKE